MVRFFRQYRYAQAVIFVATNVKMTPLERSHWTASMMNLHDIGFIHRMRVGIALRKSGALK